MKDKNKYHNNKSGVKGVYWYPKLSKWVSRATLNNKKIHIGYFNNIEDAKKAFEKFFEENRYKRISSQEKHGMYGTKTYLVWRSMINRCNLPSQDSYRLYGGRGIDYCNLWSEFINFYNDMGECYEGMSLDRIDNNAGYYKENCRWVDDKTQANNKRNNFVISAFGKNLTLSQWSELTGIKRTTISERIRTYGWTTEDALKIKKRGNKKSGKEVELSSL